MRRGEKRFAVGFAVVMIGALLSPLSHGEDSFPLSTFPMFSRARPKEVQVAHVIAVYEDGRREVVPPGLVYRSEVLQTKVAIRNAIQRKKAKKLCQDVATRLRDAGGEWLEAQRLEIRTDRYLVAGYFTSAQRPIWSQRHASCLVIGPVGNTQ
ncbi:MAG: hypothetical protein AAGA56_08455 [Myxococcota bacterium]